MVSLAGLTFVYSQNPHVSGFLLLQDVIKLTIIILTLPPVFSSSFPILFIL